MYEGQSEEKKSTIQRAEEGLYSREVNDAPIIGHLTPKEYDVRSTWDDEEGVRPERENTYMKKKRSMLKNILISSLAFFIVAMAFTAFMLYGGSNTVSPDSINMSVVGPVSVDAGKTSEMQVLIENKSPSTLLSVELSIDLPDGSYATMEGQENVTHITKTLGDIAQNGLINESFKATFFGEENKEKKILVTLEYRFEGSNATLIKETQHSVLIVSSQVGFTLSVLHEVSSGQEIELVANIDSSTSETLQDLMFEMNYPFGFTYTGSNIEPTLDNNVWVIDSLKPFGSQEIKIRGVITGQDDNSKVFAASLGAKDTADPRRFETVYSRVEESLIIKRPFIGLKVMIDGKLAETAIVVKGKDKVEVTIPWVNNLDTKIIDMGVEAKIKHPIVDRSSISLLETKGYYRSLDDTVIWDQRTNPEFAVVMPGTSGTVGFTFNIGPIVQNGTLLKDPEIIIEAISKGRRLSDVNVVESLKTPAIGKARLLTSVDLVSQALYKEGPIKNTGSIPPKVDQETTYTIRWRVTNGTSNISNTVVRTTLPTYVTWKGVVSPNSESVLYNDLGGEVVWNVGEIPAGVGVTGAPREVSFQVGFIPSVTQMGDTPALTTGTTITAIDDFTGSTVTDSENARDTNLTTESGFDIAKDGKVTR